MQVGKSFRILECENYCEEEKNHIALFEFGYCFVSLITTKSKCISYYRIKNEIKNLLLIQFIE